MALPENSQIPTLSISDLKSGHVRDRFRHCLTRHGVFFVTGCAVSETDHQSARDAAIEFFEHGTAAEKKAVVSPISTIRRGFTGLESESTAKITDTGDYTDFSMCYSMGKGANLFPSQRFKERWEAYFDLLNGAAKEIGKAVLDTMDASSTVMVMSTRSSTATRSCVCAISPRFQSTALQKKNRFAWPPITTSQPSP